MKAAPLFQVPFHLVACIEANLLNSGEKLMQAGVVFESRKIPVVPQAGFLIYIYIICMHRNVFICINVDNWLSPLLDMYVLY